MTNEEELENSFLKNRLATFRLRLEKDSKLTGDECVDLLSIAELLMSRVEDLEFNLTEQINESLIEAEPGYMEMVEDEEDEIPF